MKVDSAVVHWDQPVPYCAAKGVSIEEAIALPRAWQFENGK